jgi:D-amino-acid dehydrogenase
MSETTSARKTIVIGGGLIGLSTALQLTLAGEEVTVLEKAGVASGASDKNGGMLTPSMPDPWNGPGVHTQLLNSLFDPNSAMKLRLKALPSLTFWGLKFLRHSSRESFARATNANWALANYSVTRMARFRARFTADYDHAKVGTMKVFRSAEAMEHSIGVTDSLRDCDLNYRLLDKSEILALEPALADAAESLVGGVAFPDDESGDPKKFCDFLAKAIIENGGVVRTDVAVEGVDVRHGKVTGVRTQGGAQPAQRVVAAMGCESGVFLRRAGVAASIKPVKGYTLTFDAERLTNVPRIPVIDDQMHAAVVPIGNRLRVAGTAEFTGFDATIRRSRVENLFSLLKSLYPGIANQLEFSDGRQWAGLRPVSADGRPYIGESGIKGLYVNSGHGHLGWSMAMGSACLLADLMMGNKPEIDPTPYRVGR